MGIFDIFKKIIGRVTGSEEEEEEFGTGLGEEELGALGEETEGKKEEEELGLEKEHEPEEKEELAGIKKEVDKEEVEEAEEEVEEEKPATGGIGGLQEQLETIKSKLDLVDAHLKNLEGREDVHKIESDRYIQYLTFISEKLDHLERELGEVERIVRKRE